MSGIDYSNLPQQVLELFKQVGWPAGLSIVTILFFYWRNDRLYKRNLDDKQQQIDRLAAENKEYRDRLTALMDRELNYKKPPLSKLPTPKPKKS